MAHLHACQRVQRETERETEKETQRHKEREREGARKKEREREGEEEQDVLLVVWQPPSGGFKSFEKNEKPKKHACSPCGIFILGKNLRTCKIIGAACFS